MKSDKRNLPVYYMLRILLPFVFSISLNATFAQNITASREYPKSDFRPPLDLPPIISGSFGELRGNHFHSGMDFKTNQREGYPVYAVADGHISRLRVQSVGFGNAVYITHANGFSTVYGHLQRFNDRISQTIKNYQYRIESFEVDFPLLSVEIPVKKGEIIAWSGNSGSSGGPHLHFEIRDSQTEEIINPQLFGLSVPDKIKPTINGLYMYRLNNQPFSENIPKQYFQVTGAGGSYKLNLSPVINFTGEVGFGVITSDKNSASQNTLGVYSIELFMDNKLMYSSVWERFFFEHSRSINSHLDHPAYILTGRRIQKSFIEPGNFLTLYNNVQNSGLISLTDNEMHTLKYVIKDVAGNSSTLNFRIKNNPQAVITAKETQAVSRFLFNQDNEFSADDFRITIPKGALYSDLDFTYKVLPKPPGSFSKTHQVHTRLIPLNSSATLYIKPDSTLNPRLIDKALIANSRGAALAGSIENGFIKSETREFGNYYIKLDTVPPRITPVNISDGRVLTGVPKIIFKISDNLSGIRNWRATINGKWVLMEFDAKTGRLWHTFDGNTPGIYQLQLVVSDMKMNNTIFDANFKR